MTRKLSHQEHLREIARTMRIENECDEHPEAAYLDRLADALERPTTWVNINAQGDVTHHNNSRMSWSKTPLFKLPEVEE